MIKAILTRSTESMGGQPEPGTVTQVCRTIAQGGRRCAEPITHRRARQRAGYAAQQAKALTAGIETDPNGELVHLVAPGAPATIEELRHLSSVVSQAVGSVQEWWQVADNQGRNDLRPTPEAEAAEITVVTLGAEVDKAARHRVEQNIDRLSETLTVITGGKTPEEYEQWLDDQKNERIEAFDELAHQCGHYALAWGLNDQPRQGDHLTPLLTEPGEYEDLGDHLPDLVAHVKAIRALGDIRAEYQNAKFALEDSNTTRALTAATYEVLHEIRDFAEPSSLQFSGSAATAGVVAAAVVRYPKDWVQLSNSPPKMPETGRTAAPLRVERRGQRAHYNPRWIRQTRAREMQWHPFHGYSFVPDTEPVRNVRRRTNERDEPTYDFELERETTVYRSEVMARIRVSGNEREMVHELAHRMEDVVPGLAGLQVSFLWRRAARDSPVEQIGGFAKPEFGWEDGFAAHYIGKTYGTNPAREVLSCGMEGIANGSYGALVGDDQWKADADHRAFVIGCLAAVGGDTNQ